MSNESASEFITPVLKQAFSFLTQPPVFIRLFRAFTFPVVALTRQNLGERYYRSALIGRALFFLAAVPGSLAMAAILKSMVGGMIALIWGLVSFAAGLVFVWLFLRNDRQLKAEIQKRKDTGVLLHSYYMGTPRFGLPDNDYTNRVVLPTRVAGGAIMVMLVAPALGLFFIYGAIGLYIEYVWRAQRTREAFLDEVDRNIAYAPPAGQAAQPVTICTPAESNSLRRAKSDPLVGFESVVKN